MADNHYDAIENQRYDVIVVNYANGDMVGHSGNLEAAVKAVGHINGLARGLLGPT